ncbi:histone acetylation protein-domain-containing protein [Cladochytrium replicatum]|nr:histone acetylation protein-domain-containing protein [Cladochytrium replicatum]
MATTNLRIYFARASGCGGEKVDRILAMLYDSSVECFIYALSISVFEHHQCLSIDKLDSSGVRSVSTSKGSLAGEFVREVIKLLRPRSVRLFARPQPQYLFPESAKNADKRIMTDRQLIRFWKWTLEALEPKKLFLLVPGEESGWDKREDSSVLNPWATRLGPFNDNERAEDVFPPFTDDPLTRALSTLKGSDSTEEQESMGGKTSPTVGEVVALLPCMNECANGICAFISVYLDHCDDATSDLPPSIPDQKFDTLLDTLLGVEFSSGEQSLESSKKILSHWKESIGMEIGIPMIHETRMTGSEDGGQKKDCTAPRCAVNDLHTVVKKRKPDVHPEPVNNLQGLVKRRR